jgi:hypothetical protein
MIKPSPTKLSRQGYAALLSGLSKAFKIPEFESMLDRELGKKLDDLIIPGGQKAPSRTDVVREVIDSAQRESWARHLLIAALVEKPDDPGLLAAEGRILEGAQRVLPALLRIIREPGFDPDAESVTRSYERCTPPDGDFEPQPVPEYGGGRSALDYCYALAEFLVRRDGSHPLLGFVSLVRDKVSDAGVRDRLKEWLAGARKQLRARSSPPGRREAQDQGPGKRFLLVRVRDTDMDPGRYRIQAWLWGDDAGPGLLPEEAVVDEAGIAGALDRAREELVRRKVDLREIVVEVFLPRALLDRAVDQWRINPFVGLGGGAANPALPSESRLGSEHEVVVRPLDRISYAQALNDARSRWQRARQIPGGFTVRESAYGYRGKKLVAVRIKNGADGQPDVHSILKDNGVICCLFDREPVPPVRGVDPLAVWIYTGVPAALWLRRPADGLDVAEELDRVVRNRRLDELPERVFRLRADPTAPEVGWHLGRALALLYDDPSRIPVEDEETSRLQGD